MRLRVCLRTREYRRTASAYRVPGQWVIELGCHEGLTSGILLAQGYQVLALDRSRDAVERAARRFPKLRCRVLDALDLEALRRLMEEEQVEGLAGCFVDLGGDAALSSVLMCLANLQQVAPELDVVVKSEELLKLHRCSKRKRLSQPRRVLA